MKITTRVIVSTGAAMLPMSELEYTGIMGKLEQLDGRVQLRGISEARH